MKHAPVWIFLTNVFFLMKSCAGSGMVRISLQSYRLGYANSDPEDNGAIRSLVALPQTIDVIQSYRPKWVLQGVFNPTPRKDAENTTAGAGSISSEALVDMVGLSWPWTESTECRTPRYRFVICLDYVLAYNASMPCVLQRVQTETISPDRSLIPSSIRQSDVITFNNVLGVTNNDDVIPNPLVLEFAEWEGPVRLSVHVMCCGEGPVEAGCQEVLKTTVRPWPRSLVQGSQTLRYSVEGNARMTLSVSANCDANYFGPSCNVFCQVESPAVEHMFCNSSTGLKQCLKGWEGPQCQVDTNECRNIVCKNGGTCRNLPGSFRCVCPFGTRGRLCQQRFPVCSLQPCQHQGSCLDTAVGTMCFCLPGFTGQWCHLLDSPTAPSVDTTLTLPDVGGVPSSPEFAVTWKPDAGGSTTVSAFLRTRDQKDESHDSLRWQHWYLAIIIGGLLLIFIVIVLILILFRSRLRKRYKVNAVPTGAPPPRLTPVAKTRSFDNVVYQRDDLNDIIQPNNFHFVMDNNINKIIDKNLNKGYNSNNSNNLLNSGSGRGASGSGIASHEFAGSGYASHGFDACDSDDGDVKIDFSDGVLLNPRYHKLSKGPLEVDRRPEKHVKESKFPESKGLASVWSYDDRGIRGQNESQWRDPGMKSNNWEEGPGINSKLSKSKAGIFVTGTSSKAKTTGQFGSRDDSSAMKGEYSTGSHHRNERPCLQAELYEIDRSRDRITRENKRKSRDHYYSGLRQSAEHYYEDIDDVYRPIPKPRTTVNSKRDTRQGEEAATRDSDLPMYSSLFPRRTKASESTAGRDPSGYRRGSYGFIGEHSQEAQGARYDRPRLSEGNVVSVGTFSDVHETAITAKQTESHKTRNQPRESAIYERPIGSSASTRPTDFGMYSLQRSPELYRNVRTSDISPGTYVSSSYHPSRIHHGDNSPSPVSSKKFQNSSVATPRSRSQETAPASKTRKSSKPSSGFLSPRSSREVAYRNTDSLFKSDFSGNKPTSQYSGRKGRSRPGDESLRGQRQGRIDSAKARGSTVRDDLEVVMMTNSPASVRRRRKSEVMAEKIFGKKRTSELRRDSETAIDVNWWQDDDHSAVGYGDDDEDEDDDCEEERWTYQGQRKVNGSEEEYGVKRGDERFASGAFV